MDLSVLYGLIDIKDRINFVLPLIEIVKRLKKLGWAQVNGRSLCVTLTEL